MSLSLLVWSGPGWAMAWRGPGAVTSLDDVSSIQMPCPSRLFSAWHAGAMETLLSLLSLPSVPCHHAFPDGSYSPLLPSGESPANLNKACYRVRSVSILFPGTLFTHSQEVAVLSSPGLCSCHFLFLRNFSAFLLPADCSSSGIIPQQSFPGPPGSGGAVPLLYAQNTSFETFIPLSWDCLLVSSS